MEVFFNDVYADRVQLISLPVELIGFAMVLLEIYWPHKADAVEGKLDVFSTRRGWDSSQFSKTGHRLTCMTMVAWMVLVVLIVFNTLSEPTTWSITSVIGICYLFLVTTLGQKVFAFLNRITNGKALGALGLILASIGLLGEVYQVLTMYLG